MPASAYMMAMATLSIRNLPDEVHRRLRMRAAEHGRSMEAEARAILEAVVGEDPSPEEIRRRGRAVQVFVRRLYGGTPPSDASHQLIAERRLEAEREASE